MGAKRALLVAMVALAILAVIFVATNREPTPDVPDRPDVAPSPDSEAPIEPDLPAEPVVPAGWRMMDGLVLDAETLGPVEGARIRFLGGPDEFETTTDALGAWRHPLPRRISLRNWIRGVVTAPGYLQGSLEPVVSRGGRLHPSAPPVLLRKPDLLVRGRVIGPDGRPIAGARVRVGWDLDMSRTDAEGRFGPVPAAPGSFDIAVFTEDGIGWVESVPARFGARGVREVTVRIPEPRYVGGITLDQDRKPLPDVVVRAGFGVHGPQLRSDSDGRFRWPLLGPELEVWAEKENYVFLAGRCRLRPGLEAEIVLERGAHLEGRVVSADGSRPPAGLVVNWGRASCPLDPDGGFRLGPIAASLAELRVEYPIPMRFNPQNRVSVWSPHESNRVVARDKPGLRIAEHREGYLLRLPALVAYEGTVIDATTRAPIAGASVEHVVTDAAGRYSLLLAANHSRMTLDIAADGYLPAHVVYEKDLSVPLRPARMIDVEVVDETGEPLPGVIVRVTGATVDEEEVSAVTGLDGRCRAPAAGGEAAEIRLAPHRRDATTISVPPGQSSVRAVIAPPRLRFVIHAKDETGKPLPDAWMEHEDGFALADSSGQIELLESPEYVTVTAPGRVAVRFSPSDYEAWTTVPVVLGKSLPARFRFFYPDGRPITALEIEAFRRKERTDAEGRVSIHGLGAGRRIGIRYSVPGWNDDRALAITGGEETVIRLPGRGEVLVRFAPVDSDSGYSHARFFLPAKFSDPLPCRIDSERGLARLNVQEGTASLCFRVPPGAYRYYPDLHIRPGRPIELEYDFPQPGRITGTVTDIEGAPLPDAEIHLKELAIMAVARTGRDGRFTLELRPDYAWNAVGPIRLLLYHDDCAPGLTAPVDLSRDQRLRIALPPGGTLRGRVLGAGRSASIRILTPDAVRHPYCNTREDGTFSFRHRISAGRHRARVRADGKTSHHEFEIEDGKETEVTFDPE